MIKRLTEDVTQNGNPSSRMLTGPLRVLEIAMGAMIFIAIIALYGGLPDATPAALFTVMPPMTFGSLFLLVGICAKNIAPFRANKWFHFFAGVVIVGLFIASNVYSVPFLIIVSAGITASILCYGMPYVVPAKS